MKKHKHILDSAKMYIPKLKGKFLSKYWYYPCKNCKIAIPEYAVKYIWKNNELMIDKSKNIII